jgi:hypothetical protein
MFALFGVLFIVIGVISLVKRDWMWTLTRIGNDFEGEASQRNELWELRTVIGGVAMIILGFVLILMPSGPVTPTPPGPPFQAP